MSASEITAQLWTALGGEPSSLDDLEVAGEAPVYRSRYRADDAATATIGVTASAAAEVWRVRSGTSHAARVDARHAAIAFRSERYLRVDGGPPPESGGWIGGFYPSRDGRIVHVHTSFLHHQERELEVLGCAATKEAVAAAVATWDAEALEAAIQAGGGVARVLRTPAEWAAHPQGRAVAALPPLVTERLEDAPARTFAGPGALPLEGVRVLDLTRVIAGPVCGRTLAACGADVLLVGNGDLPQLETFQIDTGFGKRATHLDLRSSEGRARLLALAAEADVLVQAFRPGALEAIGLGFADLAKVRPGIVYLSLNAWSHAGPWAMQRGFDSLVQTASGIAYAPAEGAEGGAPSPLPAQVLDHGTGYIAAASVMRALVDQSREGGSRHLRVSLAQTGAWFTGLGAGDEAQGGDPAFDDVRDLLAELPSAWGALTYVRPAISLDGAALAWTTPPQPGGASAPEWRPRRS
jgi:crotonobetainyl-CoA:carnitine CoA-transferase CaiB-like acyl-CoA transferase